MCTLDQLLRAAAAAIMIRIAVPIPIAADQARARVARLRPAVSRRGRADGRGVAYPASELGIEPAPVPAVEISVTEALYGVDA
ncbi:MAG TPA: hypothetical protein VMK13_01595 [Streptosporangiaceae bacterium]|nr:hypothetical protein [Streptosporangiaceae bacterium]